MPMKKLIFAMALLGSISAQADLYVNMYGRLVYANEKGVSLFIAERGDFSKYSGNLFVDQYGRLRVVRADGTTAFVAERGDFNL